MIAVIDYGSGNVQAIKNIYKRLNVECELVSSAEQLTRASKIVLAGVGAFDKTMALLERSGLRKSIDHLVLEKQMPVIGICVGMQIMASSSDEGDLNGLGWIPARVRKFDESLIPDKPKIPHMGWNTIEPVCQHPIFEQLDASKEFYFLHSYYFDCEDPNDRFAVTNYGSEFSSAVRRDNIFGFQFHPEKSHMNGVNILKNFAEMS